MAIEILKAMDNLLSGCDEQGVEPKHWVMPQEEWLRLIKAVQESAIADISNFQANKYRDVPVHFSELGAGRIVGLVSGPADELFFAN
jgi:hypothetical protein